MDDLTWNDPIIKSECLLLFKVVDEMLVNQYKQFLL